MPSPDTLCLIKEEKLMAKTKSIESRPLIIVSLTHTKWGVARRKDNNELVVVKTRGYNEDQTITDKPIVKIKPATATTGAFRVLTNAWGSQVLLPNGKIENVWICNRDNIDMDYPSLSAAFDAINKNCKKGPITYIVERIKETYYNPQTQEVSDDYNTALKWFKGKNPLFLSSCPYQRIGMWVSPCKEKDCVDVSIYYNDRVQRKDCKPWTKAKIAGFRLYNDGTISHFYKGKVHDRDRIFETNRVNYRTFDIRFIGQYRLSTLLLDLRSPKLVGSDHYCTKLCQETLQILKEAGFPKEYWCWGNTQRQFIDTYDLINFVTHIQHKKQTKRGESIEEFLNDKPFSSTCENVLKFNKGVIVRIPGFREIWENGNGRLFDHRPSTWETDITKVKMLKAEVYERYRIWISDDGKTRSCQEQIHNGECWSQTRWDNVYWPDSADLFANISDLTPQQQAMVNKGIADFKKMAGMTYHKLYKLLPVLTRFESFVKEHADLKLGTGIKNFLNAIYRAPKLTETLIKLGYGTWFYKNQNDRYCYHERDRFVLDHALSRFGFYYASDYHELASNNMYKNLGISKEQFSWLATYENAGRFMQYFKEVSFTIPNSNNETYTNFAAVPVKYLKSIAQATEMLRRSHVTAYGDGYWDAANKIRDLLNEYHFSPLDIDKAVSRKLNLPILVDYLRMREECQEGVNNFHRSDWAKLPVDQRDLDFSHNRICEFYNLMMAERERHWRAEEEKRMVERQKQYDERFKKLKSLSYKNEEDDKIIVVPQKLIELVVEGQVLHHCVGSFAKSVSEGKDTIVFLRKKDTPDVPYATISLLKDGEMWRIDQAHTAHNGPITTEDVSFLKKWAIKAKVNPSTIQTNYGLHCHH